MMLKTKSIHLKDFLLVVFLLALFVLVHEFTHVSIAKDYGCSTSISFNSEWDSFVATYQECPNLSSEKLDDLRMTQSIVEAVGYQLFPVYIILVMILPVLKRKF